MRYTASSFVPHKQFLPCQPVARQLIGPLKLTEPLTPAGNWGISSNFMVWYATLKVSPRGRLGGEQLERVTNGQKQVAIGTNNKSASFFELVSDEQFASVEKDVPV
jgi:hypothetical protein